MIQKPLYIFILIFCFFYTPKSIAQKDNQAKAIIAELISAYIENSGEEGDLDFNTLYEQYEIMESKPINLNKATRSDLQEIFFLSEIQISNLLDHRNKLGDLITIYELQTIPSFDASTVRLMKEVSTTKIQLNLNPKSFRTKLNDANHTIYLKWKRNLQKQKGFRSIDENDPKFLGSPDHVYLRYKMNVGNDIKIGFIAEKDAGEPIYYKGKTYGADYFSFHFFARDLTEKIRFLAIGDYAINFGQGLIMHNGFGAGKSSLTTSIRKGGYAVKSYSSVSELNFLRGAATTIRLSKNLEWTSFLSSRLRSGSIKIDEDDATFGNYVSSLPLGGLNRTESEISRKQTLRQNTVGTSIKYRLRKGHIAVQGLADIFNTKLIFNSKAYQQFYPNGSIFWNASADYGYNWRNFNFFGEVALSTNLTHAQIHGILIGLDKRMDLVFAYRNYQKGYLSLTANAFGESPNATNEQGFYTGLEWRPSKGWIVNAYADHWKNPWLKFRVDAPSSGREYFLKVKYFKKRTWEIYSQLFLEDKQRNENRKIDAPVQNIRQRLRLHGAVKMSKALELRNRIEFAWYGTPSHQFDGFLVYQDFIYKPIGKAYRFSARYAFFDISDFDARIYAYENDILNEYYIPAYNGKGMRFYLNTRVRINYHITAELRYEATKLTKSYRDKNGDVTNTGFGSGNSEIEGRLRSQVKAQIKYKF